MATRCTSAVRSPAAPAPVARVVGVLAAAALAALAAVVGLPVRSAAAPDPGRAGQSVSAQSVSAQSVSAQHRATPLVEPAHRTDRGYARPLPARDAAAVRVTRATPSRPHTSLLAILAGLLGLVPGARTRVAPARGTGTRGRRPAALRTRAPPVTGRLPRPQFP